jgi:hypothetical protein
VNGRQRDIANKPIPQQLQVYCDSIILEDKIKSNFELMKQFHQEHDKLQMRISRIQVDLLPPGVRHFYKNAFPW